MIDWTYVAIAFVFGGTVVHVWHEAIWHRTARRITRDVVRDVTRIQIRRSSGGHAA